MFIKKKHVGVILWSASIIAVVFISTLVVFNVYSQWKERTYSAIYREKIRDLTAEMFSEEVFIDKIDISISPLSFDEEPRVILTGTLLNSSSKKIDSALLEVEFTTYDGKVLYKTWIYMFTDKPVPGYGLIKTNDMVDFLKPGESFLFRHTLLNFPEYLSEKLSKDKGFARTPREREIELNYRIKELSVI